MSTQTTFCPFVRNNIRKLVASKMLDVETIKEWEEAEKIDSMYNAVLTRANSGDVQAMYMLALGHIAGKWWLTVVGSFRMLSSQIYRFVPPS